MIFKKKEKKEERKCVNATAFIRIFCGLIIPRVRAGKDVETAWKETRSYFVTFAQEYSIFEKAIEKEFSSEVITKFRALYYEQSEKSIYLNLLLVLHHCYDYGCSVEEIAERLFLYEIKNTSSPYASLVHVIGK